MCLTDWRAPRPGLGWGEEVAVVAAREEVAAAAEVVAREEVAVAVAREEVALLGVWVVLLSAGAWAP